MDRMEVGNGRHQLAYQSKFQSTVQSTSPVQSRVQVLHLPPAPARYWVPTPHPRYEAVSAGCLDSMERRTVKWNSGTVEWNSGMVERWNSGMGNYD